MSYNFGRVSPEDFPGSLGDATGDELRAVAIDGPQPRTAARWLKRFGDTYDLLGTGGRAASITGISSSAPRLTSAEGAWSFEKRRRVGWEYVLLKSDGQHAGWYSGSKWLPGGTISLIDGTQVALRRSFGRTWKLQTTDTRERCLDIRRSRGRRGLTLELTIRSFPAPPLETHLLILTTCAVLLLDDSVPGVQVSGSGG